MTAIEEVAALRRGESIASKTSEETLGGDGVGARAAGYGAADLVTGDRPFVGDMTVNGMLHGAVRFSDHPRAVVKRIDTRRAARRAGCRGRRHLARRPGRSASRA